MIFISGASYHYYYDYNDPFFNYSARIAFFQKNYSHDQGQCARIQKITELLCRNYTRTRQ